MQTSKLLFDKKALFSTFSTNKLLIAAWYCTQVQVRGILSVWPSVTLHIEMACYITQTFTTTWQTRCVQMSYLKSTKSAKLQSCQFCGFRLSISSWFQYLDRPDSHDNYRFRTSSNILTVTPSRRRRALWGRKSLMKRDWVRRELDWWRYHRVLI